MKKISPNNYQKEQIAISRVLTILKSCDMEKTVDSVCELLYDTYKVYQARAKRGRPQGFSRIKKIPYQAPPTQLGLRKCTF